MTKPKRTQDEVATERFGLISPLIGEGMDKGLRSDIMRKITERGGVSERTVRRWLASWQESGFEGLKPSMGYERPDARLPEPFDGIVEEAIGLRRESPSRSVRDIIKILELEGKIEPGSVSRSTLQRRLQDKGFSASQIRMYVKKGAAARRFQKEHRCQLWQSDVKYGPYAAEKKGGRKKQLYLVSWIDDATRFVVSAGFYTTEGVSALEDSLRTGVQKYGAPDAIFVDNGSGFRSGWLKMACAKIGTKYLSTRPYHAEGKGKVEAFNKTAGKFISEAALKKFETISEYNEYLHIWLTEDYHKDSKHTFLPGISPGAAFAADSRPLRFVPEATLRDAFLHSDTRKVDKTGCVSFSGALYEVGLAYIGRRIGIRFDPSWQEEIEACPDGVPPFMAKKLVIGENCGSHRELPEKMQTKQPETSRLLDALEKKHRENTPATGIATAFKAFWEGDENV
jgi:transposase InsO family protein